MLPELLAALTGLGVAFLSACTVFVGWAGWYAVGLVKNRKELAGKQHQLAIKELELRQVEMEERTRVRLKAAALDAAAIAQETSFGRSEPLSGRAKASLAAVKLTELEPAAAALDGSKLNDLVKLGAAQLRASMPSMSLAPPPMTSPSSAPPPPDDVGESEGPPTLPPPSHRARDAARAR